MTILPPSSPEAVSPFTAPEVAGPELASRLEPEKYDRNILYVLARNNAELFEIRQFKLRGLEARAKRHPAFAGLRQIRIRCR